MSLRDFSAFSYIIIFLHKIHFRCEENAFRAGQEFAQSLDNIAAVNAEKKNNLLSCQMADDITNENMKLFDVSQSNSHPEFTSG